MALEQNLDFRARRYTPMMREAGVSSALSTFDPTLSANISGSQTRSPGEIRESIDQTDSTLIQLVVPVPRRDAITSTIGISKRFAFGTTAGISASNTWARSAETPQRPETKLSSTSLALSLEQPLLEGFGREITEMWITLARNSLDQSMSQLNASAIGTVQEVEVAYWNLVKAIGQLEFARLSREEASRLLTETRARAESGAQPASEILSAEIGVADADQTIITSEAAVSDREDELKRLTNLAADPGGWDVKITPTDSPIVQSDMLGLDSLFAIAMRNRPDVYQNTLALRAHKMNLVIDKDRLLPTLNATGTYSLSGSDTTTGGSLSDLSGGEANRWSLRLNLTVPIGNRSAESRYRTRRIELRQAELEREALEQTVYAEVRTTLRAVENSRQQIAAAERSRRLNEAQLEQEKERLRLGLSTNYEVLTRERSLADARNSYLGALIGHQTAVVDLEVKIGRLLQSRNIRIGTFEDNDLN